MSLRRQYFAKLGSNLLGLVAGLVTLSIVPRELGPVGYGRYEFLSNFFQQVKSFFDMGSSAWFFTRLSQAPGDRGLVAFYRRLLLVASTIILCIALLLSRSDAGTRLWQSEEPAMIGMAAILAGAIWWLDAARKMADAYRLTIHVEIVYAAIRLLVTIILFFVVWVVGLTPLGYFVFLVATTLMAIVAIEVICAIHRNSLELQISVRGYAAECWNYSNPLLTYALISTLVGVADRWILQTYGGAVEQGLFGLAYQVGAVCFIFTGAISQLLMREFSVAWEAKDIERIRQLFVRIVPALYVVAAYFCIFVAANARDIAWLVGGQKFEQGATTMAIMALYPLHQTYGQLSGSIYYATGKTCLYRNIGIVGSVVGLPVMYWLVAPSDAGGLALGSEGLAVKMVALQFLVVTVSLWFNVRMLQVGFQRLLVHQFLVPGIFFGCSLMADLVAKVLAASRFIHLLTAGFIYTILVVVVLWVVPAIAGLERKDIEGMARRLLV